MLQKIKDFFYDRKRKRSGTYGIEDPTETAKENPYTFHMPSEAELDTVTEGTIIKLNIKSIPPSRHTHSERMWVIVTKRNGNEFTGKLNNIPYDIPQLKLHDELHFVRHEIINVLWEDKALAKQFETDQENYFARCIVDDCIIDDGVKVGFIYREKPEELENCDYPDTGWRIRGDNRGTTDTEMEARPVSLLAIGVVLNKDDSFLHLLDEPVGSEFERNFETDEYFTPEIT